MNISRLPKLFYLLITQLLLLLLLLTACYGQQDDSVERTPTPSDIQRKDFSLQSLTEESKELVEEQIITTPTPEPTATPGLIEEAVGEVAVATGMDRQIILGLTGEDWVNLGISLAISLLGVFVITRFVYFALRAIAKSTHRDKAVVLIETIQAQVRWFFGIIILQYAINRLIFLPAEWKQSLNQFSFALYIAVLTSVLWELIGSSLEWVLERRQEDGKGEDPNVFIPIFSRLLRGLIIIIAVTIVLNNYGVNVTAFLALLGIGGLALSLAAQDSLSDMINGFLILLDQPYRIGDRIEVRDLDTWGDVLEIGTRTTRIQTRDNRMVIIPNATIGKGQVVNYSYPDPKLRLQTQVGIAYGSDHNHVRRVIVEAVRNVDGVLSDESVDALLFELGDSAMKFRVRWWIDSYADMHYVNDQVHSALLDALDRAGIEMPYTTYDVNLLLNRDRNAGLSPGYDEHNKEGGDEE